MHLGQLRRRDQGARSRHTARWNLLAAAAISAVILIWPARDLVAIAQGAKMDSPPGGDFALYRDAASRWLSGHGFYESWQLTGHYAIWSGASPILYPPVALLLFIPFTFLPACSLVGASGRDDRVEPLAASTYDMDMAIHCAVGSLASNARDGDPRESGHVGAGGSRGRERGCWTCRVGAHQADPWSVCAHWREPTRLVVGARGFRGCQSSVRIDVVRLDPSCWEQRRFAGLLDPGDPGRRTSSHSPCRSSCKEALGGTCRTRPFSARRRLHHDPGAGWLERRRCSSPRAAIGGRLRNKVRDV